MKKLCMKQIFMALVIFIALIGCSSLLVYSAENENYGLSNAEYDGYIVSVELDPYLASLAEEDGEPIQAIVEDKNLYYAKDLAEVERLKEMGKVSYVEPNYIVELADVDISADTANGTAWAHTMIGMDTTLKNGYLGEGVKIGIIDSGLNTTHYDIRDAVIEGYDYYSNDEIYTDSLGHGTFVAGICAARLNGQGMIGVAPKSDIVVLKAFEGNNTSANVIAKAIYGGVDNFGCDVLNMSFALTVNSQILKDAIDYANSKGVLISAAVGNNSKSNPITYPAAYDNVIGVGSVNNLKKVYISSIKSEAVFVAAPGVSISSMSYSAPETYTSGTGTSYAAPYITGLMAVLKSIDKNITLDEVKDILINTSEDIDAVGYDINSGYGIVNIKGAVEYFLKSKNIYQNNIYTKMMDNTLFTNVNLIYRNSENADLITVLRDSIGRIRDIEVLDATNSELKNFEYTYNTENLESGEYNIEYYLLGRDSVSPFYDKRVITFTKE